MLAINEHFVFQMDFPPSTKIKMQSALLALCQLRRQRPWMSQTTGGEVGHSGSCPGAWLLSVTGSCSVLFGAQSVWRQKTNARDGNADRVRESLIYYTPHKSEKPRQESRVVIPMPLHSRKEALPSETQGETALHGFSCTWRPLCRKGKKRQICIDIQCSWKDNSGVDVCLDA